MKSGRLRLARYLTQWLLAALKRLISHKPISILDPPLAPSLRMILHNDGKRGRRQYEGQLGICI